AFPGDDATHLPDAGARGRAERLLQPRAGDGGGAPDAAADRRVGPGTGAVAVLRAGPGADGDLQLAGPALGDRAVPARGSAVPRGRARGLAALAAAALAREGAAADDRRGAVRVRADPAVALAVAGAGGADAGSGARRRGVVGVRGRAAGVHGPDPQ